MLKSIDRSVLEEEVRQAVSDLSKHLRAENLAFWETMAQQKKELEQKTSELDKAIEDIAEWRKMMEDMTPRIEDLEREFGW